MDNNYQDLFAQITFHCVVHIAILQNWGSICEVNRWKRPSCCEKLLCKRMQCRRDKASEELLKWATWIRVKCDSNLYVYVLLLCQNNNLRLYIKGRAIPNYQLSTAAFKIRIDLALHPVERYNTDFVLKSEGNILVFEKV